MSKTYDHAKVEAKWAANWQADKQFYHFPKDGKDKKYLLFALPYPSGSGLHVGHVESMTALDIMARFHRMTGKKVFFPMGWDAFGLPAENYAIKTGTPPEETTKKAINTFVKQLKQVGISYTWDAELSTAHEGYYKWTQWLFLQLYKKGLAYKAPGMVNWCPDCKTALANEQVINGLCERSDTPVVQKEMEQWYFKITDYLEELIAGLSEVDWPKPTIDQQLNWIGKKSGINITYPIKGTNEEITCFTTRPDTNYGATFVVVAPEFANKNLLKLVPDKYRKDIEKYIDDTTKKSELDRISDGRKKTGVFTGLYAVNRLNDYEMPIYVADFVLSTVGTGAVVGVPGHDGRDHDFATNPDMNLPVKYVIKPKGRLTKASENELLEKLPNTSTWSRLSVYEGGDGVLYNSGEFDGMDSSKALKKIQDYLEEKGWGKRVTTYRMRDWLISRQRYWGAPIPVVYDPDGKPHPVKEEHLPWVLPTDVDYNPKGTSPLGSSKELVERTEKLYGKGWRPEIDTMDTFVDSSWYFLRYTDPRNEKQFADKAKMAKLLPVDYYMIGPEHIVLHLLYARFFTKFLRDAGYLDFSEPFTKMRHQGIIMGPDGKRMSKSRGNIINPDEVVGKYGADTLRLYEMFMGPLTENKSWDVFAITGPHRLLSRIYKLATSKLPTTSDSQLESALHKLIQKVTADIPEVRFNTSIAAIMEFVNLWEETLRQAQGDKPDSRIISGLSKADLNKFVRLLAPFAPFMAEELWAELGNKTSVHLADWPKWDKKLVFDETVEIIVQVNGKMRATVEVAAGKAEDKVSVITLAKEHQNISKYLDGAKTKKEIFVPGKLVNFVI